MSRRGGVALLLIIGLVLAGCAPEPGDAGPGEATTMGAGDPSAEASAPDASAPTAPAIVVPAACGEVLSDAEISELTGAPQYLAPTVPSVETLPGPLARETAAGADEALACLWWVEDVWESTLPLFVFRTSAAAQSALVDGLRTSTLYTETTIDGELAFTSTFSDELFINQLVYIFVDDVWIALVAPVEPDVARAVAGGALTAITG
ncbi:hypothetical protein [Microbacterium sp.]|jgi:hypothetical protein|uniref:hypothetical protein n=1 Tax=Microbacterium sp. TaxID=51671 RepID=UPI0037C647C5